MKVLLFNSSFFIIINNLMTKTEQCKKEDTIIITIINKTEQDKTKIRLIIIIIIK